MKIKVFKFVQIFFSYTFCFHVIFIMQTILFFFFALIYMDIKILLKAQVRHAPKSFVFFLIGKNYEAYEFVNIF